MLLGSFALALVASFLYAVTNQIDKHLLENHFKEAGVGTLILFSTLLTILSIPVIVGFALWMEVSLWAEDWGVLWLVLSSVLNVSVLTCYLYAMNQEEPAVVIVFYQLVPVFTGVGGWLVLGESITWLQLGGMALILLGTGFVSFKEDVNGHRSVSWKTIFLMLPASVMWSAETILFKMVALEESLIRTLFWEGVIMVLLGILIFMFHTSYRHSFVKALLVNSKSIMSWNITNECLYMIANTFLSWATLLSTAAFIMAFNTYQAVFVFLIGLAISRKNTYTKQQLVQYGLAVVLTGVGAYILVATGIEF